MKIAIENCPMIFSYDEWPGGTNLAWAPAIWDEMFAAIPSDELRPEPRPVTPRLADDRLRARGLRLRGPDLPRPRQGPRGAAARASTATERSPAGSAGRSRGCPGSARCAGIASSPRSTRRLRPRRSRSSTRTAASRATRSWSSAGSSSRATCSALHRLRCGRRVHRSVQTDARAEPARPDGRRRKRAPYIV